MKRKFLFWCLLFISLLSLFLTFKAVGWVLVIFWPGFIVMGGLQILLLYKILFSKGLKDFHSIALTFIMVFVSLFREDRAHGAISSINPFSVVMNKFEFIEAAYYDRMFPFSDMYFVVYVYWVFLFIYQVVLLILLKKRSN